ncbi:MAG: tetratricopeptide repeat protein [Sphingobacteriales bacterium]|nr:MAG: tetratricopeptide repeat protein [Sphingobacteriales bacterium]
MMQLPLQQEQNKETWKKVFLILSILIPVVMVWLSSSYGQSGDEWLQKEYGRDIYNYYATGNKQALDYSAKSLQYQGMELYGGMFDFGMEILHRWFPSIDHNNLRHFFNALIGAILMIFTGLLARRLSGKWIIGTLALLFIFFSPRIFGESMNNPKDIPFACGFVIGLYFTIALLQDAPTKLWRNAFGLALGFVLAFGVRAAGGILLIAYVGMFCLLYYFMNKPFRETLKADNNKLFKKAIIALAVAFVVGYIIALLAWPWGLQSPISNPLAALKEMTNRSVILRVLFDGEYWSNNALPWFYEFKWIIMTSPLIVIIGAAAFVLLVKPAIDRYGLFTVFFVVFSAVFPLLYMIYKHSSVYDTWRHVFFVYPAWVVMAALCVDVVTGMIKNEKLKLAPFAVAVIALLPTMVWTVKAHPNQYTYFNEIQGGVKGAYGYYDIDYYQNSDKQAADWIHKNVKPVQGRKVIVLSNMAGIDKYFEKDTAWLTYSYGRYRERSRLDWDYYIAYPRYVPAEQMQNDKWPLGNTAKVFEVNGVPLSAIFKNKSKAGIEANAALEKKDYATAAQKYAEYIAANGQDENVMAEYAIALAYSNQVDAAIGVINKANEIDPSDPQRYQILAQLYQAKGDMQNAQNAMNRANEIGLRMQELAGPPQE